MTVFRRHRDCNRISNKAKWKKWRLTNDFDGFLVVELLVPVEHPQEGEGAEEDEADAQKHVAGETGKVDALERTQTGGCENVLFII